MGGWWSGGLGKGGGIVGLLLELGGLVVAFFLWGERILVHLCGVMSVWKDGGLILISWCMGS